MKKSYYDLTAQVERILALVEERGGYEKLRWLHPWCDAQALYQMRGSIWSMRGGSIFSGREVKREWRADMRKPLLNEVPPIHKATPVTVPSVLSKKRMQSAPPPPPTADERHKYELTLNKACDEADMARVLRFVARSIMIRKEFLTDLDPLEIPKRIIREMQALIRTANTTTPTDDQQLSLPFIEK